MSTTQKTVKQRLQEAIICMTTEQMEHFEEKNKNGLQDWERMHIAEAIVGPIRETGRTSQSAAKGRSVLEIELSNRANNTKTQPTIESLRERQYNTLRKAGLSEAEAAGASGFKPPKAMKEAQSLKEREYNAYREMGMSESAASAMSGFTSKAA